MTNHFLLSIKNAFCKYFENHQKYHFFSLPIPSLNLNFTIDHNVYIV